MHANQSVQKKKVPLDFECFDTSSYSITKGSPISKEFESKLNVSSFKSFSSDLDTFGSFGLTISDVCCNLSKKSEPKNGFHSNNIFIINAISWKVPDWFVETFELSHFCAHTDASNL